MGSQWGTEQGPPRTWTLTGTQFTVRGADSLEAAPGSDVPEERRALASLSLALEGVGEAKALLRGSGCSVQLRLLNDHLGQCSYRAKNMPVAQRAPHECWGPTPAHQVQGPRVPQRSSLKQAT